MYFATLIMVVSSIFLFSTKTERSRIVTIKKPIVINQERRTPAYFAYQQSQVLRQHKPIAAVTKSTFLTNLNEQPVTPKVELAEMSFTKKDYANYHYSQIRMRNVASEITPDLSNLAYEKVIFNPAVESPLQTYPPEDESVLSPERKWATIQGKFELIDGVGITDHYIEIKRVEEGLTKEQGRINLTAGSYSIDIESPNGYLIAQIKDKSGLIIGEDRQRLINLKNKGNFLEGPFIKVGRPEGLAANPNPFYPDGGSYATASSASNNGLIASTKAAKSAMNSSANVTIFNNQKSFVNPNEEFSNISFYSSSIARVYDPSQIYADVVSIRSTGESSETPLFTKKWLENVINSAEGVQMQSLDLRGPVIVGRILVDGKPVAGAQVQIEKFPGLRAIYLDQFMNVSYDLVETSLNGYFVFVGVEEGAHTVAAALQNQVIGSQIFITEASTLSFQNIYTTSIPKSLVLRSFDAFTSESVDVDIVSSSQDEIIQTIDGTLMFRNYVENNVSEYLVRASNQMYANIRYTQSGLKDYVHIPMIQENWLNQIKKIKLINSTPDTGIIIGFTPNLNYDAFLAGENYDRGNVVYFTKEGELSDMAVSGGGFILFNVRIGVREVVLQDISNDHIYSQVFNVENQQISVAHFAEQ